MVDCKIFIAMEKSVEIKPIQTEIVSKNFEK